MQVIPHGSGLTWWSLTEILVQLFLYKFRPLSCGFIYAFKITLRLGFMMAG